MNDAFFISWVGMGLVFIGLFALWGMMAAIVKLTNIKISASTEDDSIHLIPDNNMDMEYKRKATAIAVATAMALVNTSFTASTHQEKELLSPWQTAYRIGQNSNFYRLPRRKD
jgi:Na+-transporting methylmalonyl-CoA/oxaloacetate decarboxylase gamma subunit